MCKNFGLKCATQVMCLLHVQMTQEFGELGRWERWSVVGQLYWVFHDVLGSQEQTMVT